MWIVRLVEHPGPYGPFTDKPQAQRFADYLTAEVDPAIVERLLSPLNEVLNWRDHVKAGPSVRGGEPLGIEGELDYLDERSDRD